MMLGMDIRAQNLIDQSKMLTDEQKKWTIPDEVYATLENCSLQLENLYEQRYGRVFSDIEVIKEHLDGDAYFKNLFYNEMDFLHTSLWAIDHFHAGVAGFDHIFWQMAERNLLFGVDSDCLDSFFDPMTNQFNPEMDPLPPIVFYYLDTAGNVIASRDEFDRSNVNSMQWNFYRGLRSQRVEQRDRFRALYDRLQNSDFSFEEDAPEPEDIKYWDDPENEPILASLEEVKARSGRPSESHQDDRYAVMYSKILLTRYFGDDPGKIPSRRSCIQKVAEHFGIAEHNFEAFHKRIDRKLKRKMAFRDLGQ